MKHYLGIDPDSDKSGVCILNEAGKIEIIKSADFFAVCENIQEYADDPGGVIVGIESGYLQKGVWHIPAWMNHPQANKNSIAAYMGRVGENVGRCNQTAALFAEFCQRVGAQFINVPLMAKGWKKGKISAEELKKIAGQDVPRCNQDARDAYLIADYVRRIHGRPNTKH